MIISMTGFARSEAPVAGGTLTCELRSVNHRYLEPSLRLPEELRALEPELRATLQKELRRGKVDCTLTYRSSSQAGRELEVDVQLIGRLAPVLEQIAAAIPGATFSQIDGAGHMAPLEEPAAVNAKIAAFLAN